MEFFPKKNIQRRNKAENPTLLLARKIMKNWHKGKGYVACLQKNWRSFHVNDPMLPVPSVQIADPLRFRNNHKN